MAEPQDITRNADDSTVLLSWGESGAVTEPTAGKKATGWAAADVVDKETLNWTSREAMRWLRAMFSRYPDASENLFSSWLVRNGVWVDDGITPLDGFLSDVGGVDSLVADAWIDSGGAGAVRVQIRAAKASPYSFIASRDTYIFVPTDLIAPPTVTIAEMTFTDVPIGDPAPATPAGHVLVWIVTTDGAGITASEIQIQTTPLFRDILALSVSTAAINVSGDVNVGGILDVTGAVNIGGNCTLGDTDLDVHTVNGSLAVTTTLGVTGLSTLASLAVTGIATLNGNVTIGDAPADSHTVNGEINMTGDATIGTDSGDTLTVNATATLVGPATFSGIVTANAAVTVSAGNEFSALGDATIGTDSGDVLTVNSVANFQAGIQKAGGNPVVLLGGATITATKQIIGDATTAITAGQLTSLAVVESVTGFQGIAGSVALLPLGATVAAGATIDGGAGSTCGPFSLVQGSTLDTSASGIAKINNLQWYTDVTPSTVSGNEQFDGYRKSLGDGTVARPIYAPAIAYVDTASTAATATDITGLTVTLTIPPTRAVMVEVYVHQSVDTAGDDPKIQIRAQNAGAADLVAILGGGNPDQAISVLPTVVTNGDTSPNCITVKWQPDYDVPVPANDTWTIQVQHGVTGGATIVTTTQCLLRVTYL